MKNRSISKTILHNSTSRLARIIVITGARQTGKTTLVKKLFPEMTYLSIEDPVLVGEYKNLTASQWNLIYPMAILDEVQKEPQLIESIKSVYDQFTNTKYILLGSSQILLLKKVRESLAGRCNIIEMYPLTIPELLTDKWTDEINYSYFQSIITNERPEAIPFLLQKDHAKKTNVFDRFLQFGGYPAISDPKLTTDERYDWLKNYVRTYLERDIRDLAELRHLEPFTKVQQLFALNTAQLTNFSRIAVEAGVSSKTVQRFLEYMTISYQTLILQPWSKNKNKRLVKSAKVHYIDIGIMRTILKKKDALTGHEFETAIVSEIYKQANMTNSDLSFYHLRTTDGREVDLLIESEKGFIAIEIKQSHKVRPVDAKHLRGLEDILDKPILHRFVISNDIQIRELEDGVTAIPAVQFLT